MTPIFVINLDHRKDRLNDIAATLRGLELDWERIPAVNGRTADLAGLVDWPRHRIYNEWRPPLYGAIGCFLSHRKIWQHMARFNIQQALILEDDVLPTEHWKAGILSCDLQKLGIEQLRLSSNWIHGPMPYEPAREVDILGQPARNLLSAGTGAQLLTLAGARKCLQIGRIWFPVDDFLMFTRIVDLKTLVCQPPMWQHRVDEHSDIQPQGYYDRPQSLARRMARLCTGMLREWDRRAHHAGPRGAAR